MRVANSIARAFLVLAGVLLTVGVSAEPSAAAGPDPWTPAQLITPEALLKEISGPQKPVVICVGFKVLYDAGHVPGALFYGPGFQAQGLDDLKRWARTQPKDKPIVIYCGCCPWSHCPNVRPAFVLLKEMGFTRLQLVEIENDFGRDWRDKGYPTETSR